MRISTSFLSLVIYLYGGYMETSTIGTRIKQRRTDLGLKQLQIKELTGISSGNLSDIENNNKLPSSRALISLSNALDCSIDWILTGESRSNNLLLNERESKLLLDFRQLDRDEQDEILGLLVLKINKLNRLKRDKMSSNYGNDKLA